MTPYFTCPLQLQPLMQHQQDTLLFPRHLCSSPTYPHVNYRHRRICAGAAGGHVSVWGSLILQPSDRALSCVSSRSFLRLLALLHLLITMEPKTPSQSGVLVSQNEQLRAKYGETKRGLSPRHVQLMAIGGSIGTGLFVGIGGKLSQSGPLSLVLGYLLWGLLFVWPCNLVVAEMCAYLPVRGSIFELASRFVDPALGFAMGWTYFYAGVMLVCVEYSAIATVMGYWSDLNAAVWIVMGMVVCVGLNVLAVK